MSSSICDDFVGFAKDFIDTAKRGLLRLLNAVASIKTRKGVGWRLNRLEKLSRARNWIAAKTVR